MADSELCFLPATEMAAKVRGRDVSAREVVEAHFRQIERVNPRVNAIITRVPNEVVLRQADETDRRIAAGEDVGPLAGLPIAHKDTEDTAGIRTTYGSPIFEHHVPDADTLLVTR